MAGDNRIGGDNLAINNLNFAHGGKLEIFENLNIDVKPGEFLVPKEVLPVLSPIN